MVVYTADSNQRGAVCAAMVFPINRPNILLALISNLLNFLIKRSADWDSQCNLQSAICNLQLYMKEIAHGQLF
jgi:hypothetical protein